MQFSVEQQIVEVERELKLRKSTYSRLVKNGKMKPETARKQYELMKDVLETLIIYRDYFSGKMVN